MAKILPLALLSLAGYALWTKRDRLAPLVEKMKARAGGEGAQASRPEVIPPDYDASRPSVFNSTAMAGPRDGTAGAPSGLNGGSMGTDLGTQGEGAL